MSPRKLHIRVERASVVSPDAPIHTTRGKTNSTQSASYMPFTHIWPSPPRRGGTVTATMARAHHQKAPRTRHLRNTRESNKPAGKANITRSNPPQKP